MLRNLITISLRHLRRQPGYTTLNVLGFTVGLTACFLIIMYLHGELSYDLHHDKADRIYRISSNIQEPDNAFKWSVTQMPLGKTAQEEISEIENYVRFISNGRTKFELDNQHYFEENVFYADSTMFDVFDYNLVQGNIETALDAPNSVILSQTLAKKLFKQEDPLGQTLKTGDLSLNVTGVYKDMPFTSHIKPTAIISAITHPHSTNNNWGSFGINTYILLKESANPSTVLSKLGDLNKNYVATIFDQFGIKISYELINIRDIHLKSDYQGEPEPLGNIKYVYIFSAIAVFLVLIACINYMNLSTARSIKRSLEVGVRKVMGAKRENLTIQFMSESIILTLSSLLLSIVLASLLTPIINNTLNTHLELSTLLTPQVILISLLILITTGIISGSYPAFFLSSFKPIVALKGKGSSGKSNERLRKILVGIQFAISIFMLIGTVIIYQQMQYLQNKDLGFDKDDILKIHLNEPAIRDKWPVFQNKLSQNSHVVLSSSSASTPGNGYGKTLIGVETNEGNVEEYGVDLYEVDYDYFDVLSIPFAEGRNISRSYSSDTASAVIINEAMVRRMNWDNPIGKKFRISDDSTTFHKVVGVVKDFHQQSLYNPIAALLFVPRLISSRVLIKVKGNLNDAVKSVEADWNEVYPGIPFEYTMLDESFMEQYSQDQLRGQLFLGFSILMIFISCLGLLGLASFMAEQRTKEISIRKVLGANTSSLVSLLVKDFLFLIAIGAVPAIGLGYYFMNEWLANFQYHIEISFVVFVLVLIIMSAITILTTGFHAYRAANSNPSTQLRYE